MGRIPSQPEGRIPTAAGQRAKRQRCKGKREKGFIVLQIPKHHDMPEDIHFHHVFSRKAGLMNGTAGAKASPANATASLLVVSSQGGQQGCTKKLCKPTRIKALCLPWQQTCSSSLHMMNTRQSAEWGWQGVPCNEGAGGQAMPREQPEEPQGPATETATVAFLQAHAAE